MPGTATGPQKTARKTLIERRLIALYDRYTLVDRVAVRPLRPHQPARRTPKRAP